MELPLDKLDFQILNELQKDGRISLTDIANKLKVSVGTVRNRSSKLLSDGTISIIGRIEPSKVGFQAYVRIFLSVKPANRIEAVAKILSKYKEISFLAMVSGKYDLEVNVMCRDNDHLIELLGRIHAIAGVFESDTNTYFKVFKFAQPDLDLVKEYWK